MKKRLRVVKLILLLIVVTTTNSFALGDSSLLNNPNFYQHLIRTGDYESLLHLTEAGLAQSNPSNELIYYHSLAALELEKYNLILSDDKFWKETDTSELHFKVLILGSIAGIKLKKDSIVSSKLRSIEYFANGTNHGELIFFLKIFDTVVRQKKSLSTTSIGKIQNLSLLTTDDTKDIIKSINGIEHPKHKSPVIAGLLSAIIPGAGKWYAGYFGTPFAALFMNAVLGGVALELALKQGWSSWPAIFGYTAFSAFYAGNIIGTVYSVNIKKKENEAFYKGVLLYHLMAAFQRYDAS